MQDLLFTLIANRWATALAVAGVVVAVALLLWRHHLRGGRRGVAETGHQPYHCLTIRLRPDLVGPEPPHVLPGDPNVPAIWRKRSGSP